MVLSKGYTKGYFFRGDGSITYQRYYSYKGGELNIQDVQNALHTSAFFFCKNNVAQYDAWVSGYYQGGKLAGVQGALRAELTVSTISGNDGNDVWTCYAIAI